MIVNDPVKWFAGTAFFTTTNTSVTCVDVVFKLHLVAADHDGCRGTTAYKKCIRCSLLVVIQSCVMLLVLDLYETISDFSGAAE